MKTREQDIAAVKALGHGGNCAVYYAEEGGGDVYRIWDNARDCSPDTPQPILDENQREAVKAALRWAVRGATMRGTEPDFDPDALVLNAAYALCGPCGNVTPNALANAPARADD